MNMQMHTGRLMTVHIHPEPKDDLRRKWSSGLRNGIDAAGLAMITANYPDRRRKIATILKTVMICPIYSADSSPGDEFSVHVTAKSPPGENST
jgi:hypothetical protein